MRDTASNHKLGTLELDAGIQRRWFWLIGVTSVLLSAIVVSLLCVVVSESHPPALVDQGSRSDWIGGVVTLGMLLALSLALPVAALVRRGTRIKVYTEGAEKVRRGRVLASVSWNDVDRLFVSNVQWVVNGVPLPRQVAVRMVTTDGTSVRVGGMHENMDALAERIVQRVFPLLMNRTRLSLDRNEAITFGPFTLSRDGVAQGRKRLAWSEVRGVYVDRGFIHIESTLSKWSWSQARYMVVPNAAVLIATIRERAAAPPSTAGAKRRGIHPRRQAAVVAAILVPLGLVLLATVLLTRVVGAEFGDVCESRGVFACKDRGFSTARCVTGSEGKKGYCTRLCENDDECPAGYACRRAIWTNGSATEERSEWMCLRATDGRGVRSPRHD